MFSGIINKGINPVARNGSEFILAGNGKNLVVLCKKMLFCAKK